MRPRRSPCATSSMRAMPSTSCSRPLAIVRRNRRSVAVVGGEAGLEHFGVVVLAHRLAGGLRLLGAMDDARRRALRASTRVRSPRRASGPCAASIASSASACATVRGKPSRMKPCLASGSSMRSLMMPTTISSETSAPDSITALALRPIGVPAATAARSMSPVES